MVRICHNFLKAFISFPTPKTSIKSSKAFIQEQQLCASKGVHRVAHLNELASLLTIGKCCFSLYTLDLVQRVY